VATREVARCVRSEAVDASSRRRNAGASSIASASASTVSAGQRSYQAIDVVTQRESGQRRAGDREVAAAAHPVPADPVDAHDVQAVGSAVAVRGVISMARGLGLRTVAEGVESEEAAQVLHSLGCDQLQGYHFAPALTADAALDWWLTHEASLPVASSTRSHRCRVTRGWG
jgi:EAL domain